MWELARVPTPSCSWIGKAALTATALKAKLLTLAKQPPTSPVRIGDGKGLHLLIKSNQGATGAWVPILLSAWRKPVRPQSRHAP
jgi:hypothetical protein